MKKQGSQVTDAEIARLKASTGAIMTPAEKNIAMLRNRLGAQLTEGEIARLTKLPQPEMDRRTLMMLEDAERSATEPRLVDGSPLPEGMVPGIRKTMEFRDINQNGIEDRSEGIYMQKDLVPASSLPTMTPAQRAYQDRFFVGPDDGFTNMDPGFGMSLKDMSPEEEQTVQELLQRAQQVETAPLGQIAQELAMQGEGDDTQLAHLRAGEVVLPP